MRTCVALLLLAVAPALHAQMYKCTKEGRVTYQDSPCDGSAPPAAAPRAASPPAGGEPNLFATAAIVGPADQPVAMALALRMVCLRHFPDVSGAYQQGYRAWRESNRASVERVEGNTRWRAEAQRLADAGASAKPQESAAARSQCEQFMAATFKAGVMPAPLPAPPPPRVARGGEVPALDPGDQRVAVMLFMHEQCIGEFPDLASAAGSSYQAWRARNAPAVARVEANAQWQAHARREAEAARGRTRELTEGQRLTVRAQCEQALQGMAGR